MTAYGLSTEVSVSNFPAVQTVTGSVAVSGVSFPSAMTVAVTGSVQTIPATPAAASYMASTNGVVTSSIYQGTTTSLAYLFHPSSSPRNVRLTRVVASTAGGAGGVFTLRGAFITAENAFPQGDLQVANAVDRSDVTSSLTFRSAAAPPVRLPGDLVSVVTMGGVSHVSIFEATEHERSITLRSGSTEGFEVRTVVESPGTTPLSLAVYFFWRET